MPSATASAQGLFVDLFPFWADGVIWAHVVAARPVITGHADIAATPHAVGWSHPLNR
jgi:hypothetical protein